jgi:FKBP-type peptidyl-prolyl cis-trans isomerase (trigger factor)
MTTALNRLTDGTIELTINIPRVKVKREYERAIEEMVKQTEIKGFRKGKAPRNLVEEKADKNKIYEEVLKNLVPEVYLEAVREHNLKPIVNPQVRVISLEENKDWQIQAVTCEQPKTELGDYKIAIKGETAASKILVPGKKETPEKEKEEQVLAKIFRALLKTVKTTIPKILITEEVNRMLARLVDQTSKLGLSIEQYLSSIGKTGDQLRAEYTQQAEETLKLELILGRIADEERIEVSEKEVVQMIAAAPDETSRKRMEAPEQKAYIEQILRKRKAVEKLLKM